MWLYHMVPIMRSNYANRMTNGVDPNQTAPRSSLIRVYTVCPDLYVRNLEWLQYALVFNINIGGNFRIMVGAICSFWK